MRLSSHDASFLYGETASGAMHGVAIAEVDGASSFQEIYDYYAARIHLVPKFRQKLAFVPFSVAHPKWVDDPDFDLANHILPHRVPADTTVAQALDIAVKLGEPLLDRSRPLWLFYVIENVEGKTLIVQMTHHAFVDGATAVAMSTVLTDPTPEGNNPEPAEEWNPPPVPSDMELWQEAVREQATSVVSSFQQTLPDLAQTRKVGELMTRMARPIMQAPWNAGLVGPQRQLAYLDYTKDDFNVVRKALGGTINDVALACVVEAAARYMKFVGENTDNHNLRIMCPVNVRDENDDPLDMTGNKVSGLFPILTASPGTMAERYSEVVEEMQAMKDRGEAETMSYLQESQPSVPPMAMTATRGVGTQFDPTMLAARIPSFISPNFGFRPQQAGTNFTFSNVLGPPYTQYVAGQRIARMYGGLMLGGNLGMGTMLASFDNKFYFNFTADPRLMKNLEKYRDLVAEAFKELQQYAESTQA